MGIVMGLGTLAWMWMFDGYKQDEIRNVIIWINVVAWGLQFVGHGVFESIYMHIGREETSFDGQHTTDILSTIICCDIVV